MGWSTMGNWTVYCANGCGTSFGDLYDEETKRRTQSAHDEVCEKKQTSPPPSEGDKKK